MPFRLFDPAALARAPQTSTAADRRALLADRTAPPSLTSHREAAPSYVASEELTSAVNAALHLCAPLLLTGEPGTGKARLPTTGLVLGRSVFSLDVQSTTTAADLLYEFDAVAYFREANTPQKPGRRCFRHKHPARAAVASD